MTTLQKSENKNILKEIGSCFSNLDICKNIDNILENFIDYIQDYRFDKNGLKLWLKEDLSYNGLGLNAILYVTQRGFRRKNMNFLEFLEDPLELKLENILNKINSLKDEKKLILKKIKCLKYDSLQDIEFWKRFLTFTYWGQEDIEDLASDLMIFMIFVPEKTKNVLVDYLKNIKIEDDFINHIKRYSDVIRYHRGLFIKNLKNLKGYQNEKEAKIIAENIMKYSHCNIPPNDSVNIKNIITYIQQNQIQDILPQILSSLDWEVNCSNKELRGKNSEFNSVVKNIKPNDIPELSISGKTNMEKNFSISSNNNFSRS